MGSEHTAFYGAVVGRGRCVLDQDTRKAVVEDDAAKAAK
jgi:hypothetical protein